MQVKFAETSGLYPAQYDAIYAPERIAIIEASTKAGKTVGCLRWLLEQALTNGKEGRNFWWVAPVYGQAEIGYRRMKQRLPQNFYRPNSSKLRLTLPDGTIIEFRSAEKPDGLYGEDVYACVMDEASRMREAAWHAVRSTLTATQGPVRIIGNVRGRKNWMWRLARAAEAGAEGMAFKRLTAFDAVAAGVLDKTEIEDARRDFARLGRDDVFRELYMAEASEDGANPFGITAINNCIADLSLKPPAAAGVDLAGRGAFNVTDIGERNDRDYTAIVMLDREGSACHVERFRLPHGETESKLQTTIGRVPCLMDSTGSGDPIVEWCQRTGRMNVEGYTFTARTKQDLMEGLAIKIQNEEIHYPDGPIVAELEAFQFEYTRTGVRYSAPPGLHDDYVCALALVAAKLPWRRGYSTAPLGIPGTSKWTGVADGDAWRRYQESKRPTEMGVQDESAHQPSVPQVITGPGAGKWK